MTLPDRFTCEDVFRRLDTWLDRELSPEELKLVQEHLETCAMCAGEYRFEESFIEGVRQKMKRIDMPDGLMDRITARLTLPEKPEKPEK
jgi:mycothiol system anti-sigma-R factor